MAEDKMFYIGQKAFIERDGKVLVLFDPKLGLDFPGGKIQIGEKDLNEALRREVREETTLEIEVGDPFWRWYYYFPPNHRNSGKEVFLVGFRCKYKSGEVQLSDEHSKLQWVNKDDYHKLQDGSEYFRALEKYFESRT